MKYLINFFTLLILDLYQITICFDPDFDSYNANIKSSLSKVKINIDPVDYNNHQ
ncbi:hypothetical protein HYD52_02905 [Mycoplasmopsis bovis]|nr:hypothetical protein [Mycoplasmopsis bovis]QQH72345.1 hypothetical protein HYD52_02905 [Mycoplasmopsis bovis]